MALRRRLNTSVNTNVDLGSVKTHGVVADLKENESAMQNEVISSIMRELKIMSVEDYRVEGANHVFRIPKDAQNYTVLARHGGHVMHSTELGTIVKVPFKFDWWSRTVGMVNNPMFFGRLVLLAVCLVWIAWQFFTRDDLVGSFFKSWNNLTSK